MALHTAMRFGDYDDLVFDLYVRDHRKLPPVGGLPDGTLAWFTIEDTRGELVLTATMGHWISVIDPAKALLRVAVPRTTIEDQIDLDGRDELGGFKGELMVQTPSPNAWASIQLRADITFERSVNRAHNVGP